MEFQSPGNKVIRYNKPNSKAEYDMLVVTQTGMLNCFVNHLCLIGLHCFFSVVKEILF